LVSGAGSEGGWDEDNMGTVVGEGRREIEPSCAMLGPRCSLLRRVMRDHQLTCRVDRVGCKIQGLTLDAMPC